MTVTAQSSDGTIEMVPHEALRIANQIDDTFDGFRSRQEQAVPELERKRLDELIEPCADGDSMVEAAREKGPHDFIRYRSADFASHRTSRGRVGETGTTVGFFVPLVLMADS
ncbi:hypothetical protein [Streptomyces sp. NPDC005181]|uniref:hypothetical protein n=1 Tax=Streptomyces sp. NPDC005181 TaxID=3156869 RepID=UPI0033A8E4BA